MNIHLLAASLGDINLQGGDASSESTDPGQSLTRSQKAILCRTQYVRPEPPGLGGKILPFKKAVVLPFRIEQAYPFCKDVFNEHLLRGW